MTASMRISVGLAGLLLVGCREFDIGAVDAVPSDAVVTVATVSWTTEEPVAGYVEYGPTKDYGQQTPLRGAAETDHSVALIGLLPETEYHYRVVIPGEKRDTESNDGTFTTGALPLELPDLTVTGQSDKDFILAVPLLGTLAAPVIIDQDGNYVWYTFDDSGLDVYRVRLSLDGQSVLYNAGSVSGDPAEDSKLVRVSLDGTVREEILLPLLAHDFVELPDGTLGAMVTKYQDDLRGDSIVEVAPDGTQTEVWSSWDCFDPEIHEGDGPPGDWTFGNALDYDPDENIYYQGMRDFSSIARVDPTTRACDWVFGSEGATIEPASGADIFLHQHQFEVLEDSILLFDNDGSTESTSRVLEFAFDPAKDTAKQIWSYVPDPYIYTFVLGDVKRFDDGDTLITWSVSGQIDLVSPDGEPTWTMNTALGYAFGFNTVTSSPYVDADTYND